MNRYFKGGDTCESIRELIELYYKDSPLSIPNTYLDSELTQIDCDTAALKDDNRSFEAIFDMVNTYFPNTSIKTFLTILDSIREEKEVTLYEFYTTDEGLIGRKPKGKTHKIKSFRIFTCLDIAKPVLRVDMRDYHELLENNMVFDTFPGNPSEKDLYNIFNE